jgi:hypothetical protein
MTFGANDASEQDTADPKRTLFSLFFSFIELAQENAELLQPRSVAFFQKIREPQNVPGCDDRFYLVDEWVEKSQVLSQSFIATA